MVANFDIVNYESSLIHPYKPPFDNKDRTKTTVRTWNVSFTGRAF